MISLPCARVARRLSLGGAPGLSQVFNYCGGVYHMGASIWTFPCVLLLCCRLRALGQALASACSFRALPIFLVGLVGGLIQYDAPTCQACGNICVSYRRCRGVGWLRAVGKEGGSARCALLDRVCRCLSCCLYLYCLHYCRWAWFTSLRLCHTVAPRSGAQSFQRDTS